MGILVSNESGGAELPVCDDDKGSIVTGSTLSDRPLHKLSEGSVETLGVASQSAPAIEQLLGTGFPRSVCDAILAFCNNTPSSGCNNWTRVSMFMKMFAEMCREDVMKDWLGGSGFWLPLLKVLCECEDCGVEDSVVYFMEACCRGHEKNQQLLASTLCQLICWRSPNTGGLWFLHGVPGVVRRLLLQLLLESEKIEVCIKSDSPRISQTILGHTATALPHPHYPVGHAARVFSLPLHATIIEILRYTADSSWMLNGGNENNNNNNDETSSNLQRAVLLEATVKREPPVNTTPGPVVKKRKCAPTSQEKPALNTAFVPRFVLTHESVGCLPSQLSLSQLVCYLKTSGSLTLTLSHKRKDVDKDTDKEESLLNTPEHASILVTFAKLGGLALLAQRLPLLYPHVYRQGGSSSVNRGDKSGGWELGIDSDWVKIEQVVEDMYFDEVTADTFNDNNGGSNSNTCGGCVPPHSLAAFALFLRLPGYAEYLLRDKRKATCILRLALGVMDPPETSEAALAVLPFQTLQGLLECTCLDSDDGVVLRRAALEGGDLHLILACLAILSHQPLECLPAMPPEMMLVASKVASMFGETGANIENSKKGDDKAPQYWAKGTGFGTGSTAQSWDVEGAIWRQRTEEEHVTWLIRVLASYINPSGEIPPQLLADNKIDNEDKKEELPILLHDLLKCSCLLKTISSYLRNDSVLDMARHVPLYRAVLQLLRSLAISKQLVDLLLPSTDLNAGPSTLHLLMQMKACVDIYASRLRSKGNQTSKEEEQDEGLAQLIPDIQQTATVLQLATSLLIEQRKEDCDKEEEKNSQQTVTMNLSSKQQIYCNIMKKLQFDTWEMIVEEEGGGIKFSVSHHFETQVRSAGDRTNPGRAKRLAQETVTLSTALPLSYSSSVFVRCDQDRLDIMKVLITGPEDTPYANGCFEFDVYFPPEYPASPMMINHETTGHHTVRFNPNLYNDGKVCLSILNTWHGRPEEKWNPQTSSLLQVLVSIQSLVLVPEPYFNEPGYERSRGTPAGTLSCKEYASNIRQAAVRWAMLEQLRKPCPAFKDVIQKHFYLKRADIEKQIEGWMAEQETCTSDRRAVRTITLNNEALKRHYAQLKEELGKLCCPEELKDQEELLSS